MKKLLLMLCLVFMAPNIYSKDTAWQKHAIQWKDADSRNLLVFLDGTAAKARHQTNVRKLYEAAFSFADTQPIIAYYDKGVGATKLSFIPGVYSGRGLSKNIRQGYRFLAKTFKPRDKIYIFGFSRGAFSARSLNGFLELCGLLDARSMDESELIDWAGDIFEIYHQNNADDVIAEMHELRTEIPQLKFHKVKVEVIGVWDTVASIGLRHVRHPKRHHVTTLYAKTGCHALSIDEQRKKFLPILFKPGKNGERLTQVWFSGSHADVGGGYGDDSHQLDNISLNWMLSCIGKTSIIDDNVYFEANPIGKMHDEYYDAILPLRKLYKQSGITVREIPRGSIIHESVVERMKANRLPYPHKKRESTGVYRPSRFDLATIQNSYQILPYQTGHD